MPYRPSDGTSPAVWWPKNLDGRRPTKRASLAYWRDRLKGEAMAKGKPAFKQPAKPDDGFKEVPSDLNLWPADDDPAVGDELTGLVTHVNPAGPFGLQVKVMDASGTIFTLASHKVLQGRLESVPGGLRPLKTVLRVTFTGKEKGKKWPTPMLVYRVQYAERKSGEDDLWAFAPLPEERVPF